MEIRIDYEAGATYIRLKHEPKGNLTTEDCGDYYMDYDEDGDLVGIEYLTTPTIKEHSKISKYVRKIVGLLG